MKAVWGHIGMQSLQGSGSTEPSSLVSLRSFLILQSCCPSLDPCQRLAVPYNFSSHLIIPCLIYSGNAPTFLFFHFYFNILVLSFPTLSGFFPPTPNPIPQKSNPVINKCFCLTDWLCSDAFFSSIRENWHSYHLLKAWIIFVVAGFKEILLSWKTK